MRFNCEQKKFCLLLCFKLDDSRGDDHQLVSRVIIKKKTHTQVKPESPVHVMHIAFTAETKLCKDVDAGILSLMGIFLNYYYYF